MKPKKRPKRAPPQGTSRQKVRSASPGPRQSPRAGGERAKSGSSRKVSRGKPGRKSRKSKDAEDRRPVRPPSPGASSRAANATFPVSPRDENEAQTGAADSPSGFPIIGIGASAGGLEAFTVFLEALPPRTGMAFVFVQHL